MEETRNITPEEYTDKDQFHDWHILSLKNVVMM